MDEVSQEPEEPEEQQQPEDKPVSLNDCLKHLEGIRSFFQTNGANENVFNSLANLEKESLALSLQAKSSHQPKLTDFFNRK